MVYVITIQQLWTENVILKKSVGILQQYINDS